jgi:glycosyltransferase involved in cell wall biosynthesis
MEPAGTTRTIRESGADSAGRGNGGRLGPSEASRPGGATADRAASARPDTRSSCLHLLHVFPTFSIGGVQLRMAEVINHHGRRYRHTILALDGRLEAARRLRPELPCEAIPWPGGAGERFGLVSRLLRARRFVADRRPDLLLTYNWGAVEWALMVRVFRPCRHLHLESGFGVEEATSQIPRRVWFRRIALAPPSTLVVPSRTLVDIAVRAWRLDPRMIRYVPNGVDAERFARPPRPEALPGFVRRPGEVVVGTIAPLRGEKNIARLVRAFRDLAGTLDARLMIVGDGPERPALERLAQELDLAEKVIFAGAVDAPEDVIGWFDVYALSSDTEQMPNTLLQAMAAGLPVACLDVGDVRRIVAPSNHPFVARAGDDAGFAEALVKLAQDEAARQAVGEANRRRARADFSLESMCETYATLFDGTAAGTAQ